jgi:SAM-dependent methyltransferase
MSRTTPRSIAPYDALAPVYDLLTADYGHDRWLRALERLAREHGLTGCRVLDVGCGTGASFLPLLRAGYEVTACDLSPAMARRARAKAGGRATVHVADARRLPRWGAFDLITFLDDGLNHLVQPADVVSALRGIRANLARGGLVVLDVNTFAAYGRAPDVVAADDERFVAWRGRLAALDAPGGVARVVVEVFERVGTDAWRRRCHSHPHRHYPLAQLRGLVAQAGLRVVATRGQRTGAVLDADVDESAHTKAVLLLAATERRTP